MSRRLSFVAIAAVSASVVLVSSAEGGPSPAIPVVSVTPASSCSQALSECTTYDISIKNTGTKALNDVTVAIVPEAPLIAFRLTGQPPGKQTGVKSAMVDTANIAGGATGKGTFTVVKPLTSANTISVYTTDDGFLSSVGQDVHVQSSAAAPASKPHLEAAEKDVEEAISYEDKALREEGSVTVIKSQLHDAVDALDAAERELKNARASGELDSGAIDAEIYRHAQSYVSDAGSADFQAMANLHTLKDMKEFLAHFLKRANEDKTKALRAIKSALKP